MTVVTLASSIAEMGGFMAIPLYQKACDGGDALGCALLGIKYDSEEATFTGLRFSRRGIGLYQKACDGNNAAGCRNLAEAYRYGGGGLPKDPGRAIALYQKACDNGDQACPTTEICRSERRLFVGFDLDTLRSRAWRAWCVATVDVHVDRISRTFGALPHFPEACSCQVRSQSTGVLCALFHVQDTPPLPPLTVSSFKGHNVRRPIGN